MEERKEPTLFVLNNDLDRGSVLIVYIVRFFPLLNMFQFCEPINELILQRRGPRGMAVAYPQPFEA